MNQSTETLSLLELNNRIARLVQSPLTTNVWVTAELSDVAVRRGHCYMELLQKDDQGNQVAKARAVIWANNFSYLNSQFLSATGHNISTGLKLLVKASATLHPIYGLSLVITAIDPDYTMGDLLRRRREIIERLRREGILDMNRELPLPEIPRNIAVISAPGAAGYGDFINQLYHNPYRLRFHHRLFPAVMQGESAPASIIAALNAVASDDHEWDCVVIIRGGGATSDLQCFESYDLAANIAQFPLPVIIGLGHERDITLLDSVANQRVKTPTAAAELLIDLASRALALIDNLAQTIVTTASGVIAACKEQLSYYNGILPVAPVNALHNASGRLSRAGMALSGISSRRIAPRFARLEALSTSLQAASRTAIERAATRLDSRQQLVAALSPQAVLNRGYSITRASGQVVTDPASLAPGQVIETTLAGGIITSVIT